MTDVSAWRQRAGRFLFETGTPYPIARFRIALCTAMLCAQMAMLPDVPFFFSDQGVTPNSVLSVEQRDEFWSLLHLIGSPAGVRGLHLLYLAAILATLLGFRTGLATALLYLLAVSFRHRNPLVMNSGDQLVTIVTFWLMFADSGRVWSVDARRRAGSAKPWARTWVLRMLQFQLCFIYGCSLLQKLTDPDWRSGVALFYATANLKEWTIPSVYMMDYPVLLKGLTYGTMLFEGCFPVLVWVKKTRPLMLGLAVLFHSGIGVFLGLPFFSMYMIAMLMLFWEKAATDG